MDDESPAMREALREGNKLMRRGRVEEAASRLEAAIAEYGERVDTWLYGAYLAFSEAAALAGWLEKGTAAARRSVNLRLELLRKWRQDKIVPGDTEPFRMLALNSFLANDAAATYQALERCANYFGSPNIKYISPDGTYDNLSTICTPSLLGAVANCGVDVDAVLSSAAACAGSEVRRYPDGSIQVDGIGQEELEARALRYARHMDWFLTGGEFELKTRRRLGAAYLDLCPPHGSLSNSQAGGWCHRCVIGFWEPWFGKADDSNLIFAHAPSERISVSITFTQRLPHAGRLAFMDLLERWADPVRSEGIFGEGQMEVCESAVEFQPKLTRFRLIATRPGRHTIVWLLICLLKFREVSPTMRISIVGETYGAWSFELPKQSVTRRADSSVVLHLRHSAGARGSISRAEGATDGG